MQRSRSVKTECSRSARLIDGVWERWRPRRGGVLAFTSRPGTHTARHRRISHVHPSFLRSTTNFSSRTPDVRRAARHRSREFITASSTYTLFYYPLPSASRRLPTDHAVSFARFDSKSRIFTARSLFSRAYTPFSFYRTRARAFSLFFQSPVRHVLRQRQVAQRQVERRERVSSCESQSRRSRRTMRSGASIDVPGSRGNGHWRRCVRAIVLSGSDGIANRRARWRRRSIELVGTPYNFLHCPSFRDSLRGRMAQNNYFGFTHGGTQYGYEIVCIYYL